MYMASEPDRAWLLNEQRKLYQRSWLSPDYVFRELWGLVTDLRNLRVILARVSRNRASRTASVDGIGRRRQPKPPKSAQVCGEPGADRKTDAGFGEGHPETSPA
jgi:hypothetical protein